VEGSHECSEDLGRECCHNRFDGRGNEPKPGSAAAYCGSYPAYDYGGGTATSAAMPMTATLMTADMAMAPVMFTADIMIAHTASTTTVGEHV
jgi:hypothetical protein